MPVPSQPINRGRQANHEGSVYQIKTGPRAGEWRAQLSLPNGKRRAFSAKTRSGAEQKLREAQLAMGHADQIVESRRGTLKHVQQRLMAAEQELAAARAELEDVAALGWIE